MNIPAINSIKIFQNVQNTASKNKLEYGSNTNLKMALPLNKDTVSFMGMPKQSVMKKASATMADFYGMGIDTTNAMLKPAANSFLDTIGAVVSTIAQKGTAISEMSRDMARNFVLKSGQSAKSKALRSGSFDLTDRIRTTVYIPNLYDLSTLYEFINEMSLRGYKLAKTEESAQKMLAKGYKVTKSELEKGIVKVEDMSVRLCEDGIENARPELSFAIDGRQKSGYEDIQLRFVKGKNKFETIMLFGPNYAEAKHMESEKVRKYTREFDSLMIRKNSDKTPLTTEQRAIVDKMLGEIKFYINSLQGCFYDHVTRPLYHWAKGIDYYGMKELEKEKPNYTAINYTSFNRDFYNLKDKIRQCYDYIISKTTKEEEKIQLERLKVEDLRTLNKVRRGLEKTGTELGVLEIPPQKCVKTP